MSGPLKKALFQRRGSWFLKRPLEGSIIAPQERRLCLSFRDIFILLNAPRKPPGDSQRRTTDGLKENVIEDWKTPEMQTVERTSALRVDKYCYGEASCQVEQLFTPKSYGIRGLGCIQGQGSSKGHSNLQESRIRVQLRIRSFQVTPNKVSFRKPPSGIRGRKSISSICRGHDISNTLKHPRGESE